ncbi:hypothetical protein EVG20_g6913 [Dentipellis fragilis]|uniref:Haloacid dehalogenase, type II n=1 Tax=Dentipellis fragilis TaxID=205917 RepID=A0A4Y9YJM4_9AGAM|nr:hypothetical protein EVG20_g6913 [Dentipellis fragilis]
MSKNAESRTQILAFDVYGTLLDTSAIASEIQKYAPDKANEIATTWQLIFTARAGQIYLAPELHGLLQATTEHGLTLSEDELTSLNAAYCTLPAFPDACAALKALQEYTGVEHVIFSNGTSDMITAALDASSLLPYAKTHVLIDTVPLDPAAGPGSTRKYKPAHEVYRALLRSVGKEEHPADVWLVSGYVPAYTRLPTSIRPPQVSTAVFGANAWKFHSNPFDVTGARNCGLRALWVDRARKGWADHLLDGDKDTKATRIVHGLDELVEVVLAGGLVA